MWISYNGKETELPDGQVVADLVKRLDIESSARGVAVAVNATVIPRSEWQTRELQPADRVEILTATQGG